MRCSPNHWFGAAIAILFLSTASSETCCCIFIPFSGSCYLWLFMNPTRPFQFWDQAICCFSLARPGHVWKCSEANHWPEPSRWWKFRVSVSRARHYLNDSEIFELRCLMWPMLLWQLWLDVNLMPSCFACESIPKSLGQFWKWGQAHEWNLKFLSLCSSNRKCCSAGWNDVHILFRLYVT